MTLASHRTSMKHRYRSWTGLEKFKRLLIKFLIPSIEHNNGEQEISQKCANAVQVYPEGETYKCDLVVVRHENLHPTSLMLGRIVNVYPGVDGRIFNSDKNVFAQFTHIFFLISSLFRHRLAHSLIQ